jgi:uncharacterized protein (TIGR03435 family)
MNRFVPVLLFVSGSVALSAQGPAPPPAAPRFEVASVRPNTGSDLSIPFEPHPPDGFRVINNPLESLIRSAYQVQPFRVIGMPGWANSERFDISARAARPIADSERRLMLRSLLADRFRLNARFESREQTVYVMTALRPDRSLGPGLRPRPDCATTPCSSAGTSSRVAGVIRVRSITLDRLAEGPLSLLLEQVVRNETGIQGAFDAELSFRPDTAPPDDSRPAFFTAVEEQFGLKLTRERRPVDVLVIESLERPTPD